MKTLFTFVIAALMSIGLSVAQERGSGQNRTPEERAKMQIERLTKELELSKSQQDSIYNYFVQSSKDFQVPRTDEDREKMRKNMETRNTKIKSFLTKEQITKYEELQKTMQNRRGR